MPRVVHFEFLSDDPEQSVKFFGDVFGWQNQSWEGQTYWLVNTGEEELGINGGIMKPEHEGPWPGNMTLYIDVDDLASYREKVVGAGGKILIEEQEVPGMGAFSLFADPEGRMMGLWKTRK